MMINILMVLERYTILQTKFATQGSGKTMRFMASAISITTIRDYLLSPQTKLISNVDNGGTMRDSLRMISNKGTAGCISKTERCLKANSRTTNPK